MLRTYACGKGGKHESCFGTVMHKDYPAVNRALGPCECECHIKGDATMMEFRTFNSMEELQAFIAHQNNLARAAYESLPEQQQSVGYGDYFWREADGLMIVGRIPTTDELKQNEMRLGASEEEAEFSNQRIMASYENGYRFAQCYSVACPEGEWGSVHVTQIQGRLSREHFELALKALNAVMEDWRNG